MSKIAPFPHHYTVSLTDGHLIATPRAPIAAGPPPQFGGSDQVWSPEELLVAAALACLWTTFAAHARHDQLDVRSFAGSGLAVLEKGTQAAPPAFSSIALTVDVTVPAGDEDRARRLLYTAEQRCIVSNALRPPVTLEARVRGG